MSNYKTEVERTEQLEIEYSSVMTGIFNELKKDDSVNITTANMIKDVIRQIKNSRKRWASGTNLPYEYKYFTEGSFGSPYRKEIHYNSVNFENIIPFVPSIIMIKSNKGLSIHLHLLGKYVAIVPSHKSFPSQYSPSGGDGWYWDHTYSGTNYTTDNTRYLNGMGFNHRDVMVLWSNQYGSSFDIKSELKKIQIESWIAIE